MLPFIAIISSVQNCSDWQRHLDTTFQRYSQGTQDGILRSIFGLVGTSNRRAVEFGFDYVQNNLRGEALIAQNKGLNTRLLREQGWNVTYFDAAVSDKTVGIRKVVLTESNIAQAFKDAGVPQDIDYVSIDVDSVDVWLLHEMLNEYKPRVISVEFNRNFLHWMRLTHERHWHPWTGRSIYGASAGAINHVASIKGYKLVHLMPNGMDVFFVRLDVLKTHCMIETLPNFFQQAKGLLGQRMHSTCKEQDLTRLVDFQLELEGHHADARLKARSEVALLNKLTPENPMCE